MTTRRLSSLLALALLAGACSGASTATPAAPGGTGGGTGGGGTGGTVSGIAVPTEISAIPTSSGGAAAQKPQAARALPAAAGSDYEAAPVRRYVNERAVAQFDILNTIFSAMGQTHYAAPENVGAGPYKAMVSWVEERGKEVIPWVVDSSMTTENGADVNVVKVWMRQDMGDGQLHLIRVLTRIYQAPTRNPDGSYADYGVWKLHAKFADDPAQGYFVAEATRGAAGESVIQLNQLDWSGEVTRGVLHKSATSGYGKVYFPDWESCQGGGCPGNVPPQATVTYVYDAGQVSLRKEPASGPALTAVKDRTSPVQVVNRYGLFEAVSGDEAARHFGKTFGFPFRYTLAGGGEAWGSYGAWQGRHQIWANGGALDAGVTVTRADVPQGQAAPTFTTSPRYVGTLVRRTLEPGSLEALRDAVVNTWENRQLAMSFDGSAWNVCLDAAWGQAGQTCGSNLTLADADLGQVLPGPEDTTRSAWLSACGMQGCTQVAWKPSGSRGAGLYLAAPGDSGPPQATDAGFTATPGTTVGGGVNGQIWIVWNGSGWLRKEVLSFDPATYTVTFGSGDQAFTFPQGQDYYLNRNGASYVVRCEGGACAVKFERQTAANPGNLATLIPAGAVFSRLWGDTATTMTFDVDPASPTFLKLLSGGSVVTQGEYGLRASVNGVVLPDQFSWDYPSDPSQSWGAQQFLHDAQGALRLLDDPIQLQPVSLADGSGVAVSYALAFDGNWVNGLPDVWQELQATGYQMTQEIAARVVRIPDGQQAQDGQGNAYLWKALEVQEYLPIVAGAPLADLSAASALSLEGLPPFVEGNLGAEPAVALKYVEGVPVGP